eukprot:TRINITY_DN69483_c0_g1_i1.p1 TRINITY_DN69483_c0_g1~~TRINITY_DN69483_c0_g1_i1.p1  ORF type:complete len:329 (+),score=44.28 TRINITY_DN69483_c0_g1_i1:39-1025(+)
MMPGRCGPANSMVVGFAVGTEAQGSVLDARSASLCSEHVYVSCRRGGGATCFAENESDSQDAHEDGDDKASDPRVPRKILPTYRLQRHSPWPLQGFGLRTLNGRLFVCDSDDDKQLVKGGHCGLVASPWNFHGLAAVNAESGDYIVPVHWWDKAHGNWSGERAPYAIIPHWSVKFDGCRLGVNTIPELPKAMTAPTPGELPDPIEMRMPLPHVFVVDAGTALANSSSSVASVGTRSVVSGCVAGGYTPTKHGLVKTTPLARYRRVCDRARVVATDYREPPQNIGALARRTRNERFVGFLWPRATAKRADFPNHDFAIAGCSLTPHPHF